MSAPRTIRHHRRSHQPLHHRQCRRQYRQPHRSPAATTLTMPAIRAMRAAPPRVRILPHARTRALAVLGNMGIGMDANGCRRRGSAGLVDCRRRCRRPRLHQCRRCRRYHHHRPSTRRRPSHRHHQRSRRMTKRMNSSLYLASLLEVSSAVCSSHWSDWGSLSWQRVGRL